MALATTAPGGKLKNLGGEDRVYIKIPGYGKIIPKILPEISDTKKASYADVNVIGRSSPIKTYSYSDNRVIGIRLHFLVVEQADIQENAKQMRAIQSLTYPRKGAPYRPPPICSIRFGNLLATEAICVILNNYNVSFPSNVVWDPDELIPYYFQINTSWHVVYATTGGNALPNQGLIMQRGK